MTKQYSRRAFLKAVTVAFGAATLTGIAGNGRGLAQEREPERQKAKVYFTKDISVAGLLAIYAKINQEITGKVGIKLHTGEPHGPNLLPIELIKGLQAQIPNSTIVECNVLYPSPRQNTQGHLETLKINGFDFCPVDIMDSEGDATLQVPGMREFLESWKEKGPDAKPPFTPGDHLTEVAVGKHLLNYDSLVVYTHFKGHAMGGFGGSLKNIAIGCASGKVGKLQIHGEGWPKGPLFLERMVEAGKAVSSHFGTHITYINVLKNMSVDCDCAGEKAAKPTSPDLGILGSTDLLAVDKASTDLIYALPEAERHDIVERIDSRYGLHQLEYMKTLNMGNEQYELITL